MKATTMTIAPGGADKDRRARRFTKDARSVTGRCLSFLQSSAVEV